MYRVFGVIAAVCTLGSPAFAEPPAPQTTAGPTSVPANEPKTPASADSAASQPKPASPANAATGVKLVAGDEEAAAQLKRLKAAGYKPEVRGREIIFCRKEPELGSRFDKKVCGTADQLERNALEAKELAERTQRSNMGRMPGS